MLKKSADTIVPAFVREGLNIKRFPKARLDCMRSEQPTLPERLIQQSIVQSYLNEGYTYVIELDLEKFFDKVNHDKLMSLLSFRLSDKVLLKLIRRYLRTGILENSLCHPREEGTPQGSPLSPILSNLLLDELDKELERLVFQPLLTYYKSRHV